MLKKTKTILFGGSFDPIHNGHLRLAQIVFEKLSADHLLFVPARRSPHKSELPTPGVHRLEMIRRAIESIPGFSVSDCELNRPEPSYTIDTICYFRKKQGPDTLLYWLIGADQLEDFDKWHNVTELLEICRICVMYRAGYLKPAFERFQSVFSPEHIVHLQQNVIQTPLFDVSSTDIRRRLAGGESVSGMLPNSVVQYIREHQLYGYAH